jgi:hypothetical protein
MNVEEAGTYTVEIDASRPGANQVGSAEVEIAVDGVAAGHPARQPVCLAVAPLWRQPGHLW